MSLSKEEVRHISKLARIKLMPKEETLYTEELSSILDLIDKLQEADTKNVEPLYQVTGKENVMRKDENPTVPEKEERDEIINQFPESKDGFNKVKEIFSKEE